MTEKISHDEQVRLLRFRALTTARAVASGQQSIVEGCRYLSEIYFKLELPKLERDFDMVVGIASESDHLPVGEVRKYWAGDALKRKDIEIAEFEDLYRIDAIQACSALVPKLEEVVI